MLLEELNHMLLRKKNAMVSLQLGDYVCIHADSLKGYHVPCRIAECVNKINVTHYVAGRVYLKAVMQVQSCYQLRVAALCL